MTDSDRAGDGPRMGATRHMLEPLCRLPTRWVLAPRLGTTVVPGCSAGRPRTTGGGVIPSQVRWVFCLAMVLLTACQSARESAVQASPTPDASAPAAQPLPLRAR